MEPLETPTLGSDDPVRNGAPERANAVAVSPPEVPVRRLIWLPLGLVLATCLTTFMAGGHIHLLLVPGSWLPITVGDRSGGFIYMLAVMGILVSHEMGHFVQAVRYHVPASWPFFIPIPFGPLGTMGAVIGMQGSTADRKQMFDIGISGPLAGLVVIIPITWMGIQQATPFQYTGSMPWHFSDPLLVTLLIGYLRPEIPADTELMMNPLLLAGWVGCFVTGLNMLPVSQLDGGHVSYAIFGRGSHIVARCFYFTVVGYIVIFEQYHWSIMLILVTLIGIHHPPTANDKVPISLGRRVLGFLSLAIPIFCLPLGGISFS